MAYDASTLLDAEPASEEPLASMPVLRCPRGVLRRQECSSRTRPASARHTGRLPVAVGTAFVGACWMHGRVSSRSSPTSARAALREVDDWGGLKPWAILCRRCGRRAAPRLHLCWRLL